jgi:hypothetical protein
MRDSGLVVVIVRTAVLFQSQEDFTWDAVPSILLTMIEASVYLISACILQSRPLWQYLLGDNTIARIRSSRSVLLSGPEQPNPNMSDYELGGSRIGSSKQNSDDEDIILSAKKDEILVTSEITVSHTYVMTDDEDNSDGIRKAMKVSLENQV